VRSRRVVDREAGDGAYLAHAGLIGGTDFGVERLAASIDPDEPVIDSFVLKNLGLRLSRAGGIEARLARIVELHDHIRQTFFGYLDTDMGRCLTRRFEESYPDRHLTQVKMLDLILWQAR